MQGLVKQFKDFLLKQNALALAVGVVIGGAIGKVVSAIVDDVFMPIVGIFLPKGDWREAQLALGAHGAVKYGDLLGRCIDFVIVSTVIFFVVKLFIHDKAAPTKTCPECLETIPLAAKRCRACTAAQPAG